MFEYGLKREMIWGLFGCVFIYLFCLGDKSETNPIRKDKCKVVVLYIILGRVSNLEENFGQGSCKIWQKTKLRWNRLVTELKIFKRCVNILSLGTVNLA